MSTTYKYFIFIPTAAGIDIGAGILRKSKGFFGARTEWAVMTEDLEREAHRAALDWAQRETGMSFPHMVTSLIRDRLIPCPAQLAARVKRWKNE